MNLDHLVGRLFGLLTQFHIAADTVTLPLEELGNYVYLKDNKTSTGCYMADSSVFSDFFLIYLYQQRLKNGGLYNPILFIMAPWNTVRCLLCHFGIPQSAWAFADVAWTFSYFTALQATHFARSRPRFLGLAIFPQILVVLIGEWLPKSRNRFPAGLFFLHLLSWWSTEIHACIITHAHSRVPKYLHM